MSNAQLTNQQEVLLNVGPFGGLDLTTSPYYVDPSAATAMSNVVPFRAYKAYCTPQGRAAASYTQGSWNLSGTPARTLGLRLVNTYTGYNQPVFALVSNWPSGAVTSAYQMANAVGDASGVAPQTVTLPSGYTAPVSFGTFVVGGDGFLYPNFPNSGSSVFLGTNATAPFAEPWGIPASTTAPTVAVGAAGLLNGTYYYAYTYLGTFSAESSPTPFSAAVTVTNQQVNLSGIVASSLAAVSSINIYRMGGTIGGVPLLVGTIANGTTTFTDNVADTAVTGQQLILRADIAPSMQASEFHKGRMFVLTPINSRDVLGGQSSSLWYSNYEQLQQFNALSQVLDIGSGVAAFGDDNGDLGVALCSLSSILMVFKNETTWIVYGDSGADFVARKLIDVGCFSNVSVAKGYGKCFWLSRQGVYMYDQSTGVAQNISDLSGTTSIRSFIDTYMATQSSPNLNVNTLPPVGWCDKRCYFLSFPSQGVTFGYDLTFNIWFKLSMSTQAVCGNGEALAFFPNAGPPTYYPSYQPFTIADGATVGNTDVWFAAETDLGSPIVSSWTSGLSDTGKPQETKRATWISVSAPYAVGASCTVTVTADPGGPNAPTWTSNAINFGLGPRTQYRSLPPRMVGTTFQVTINVTSSQQTIIDRVVLYGQTERAFRTTGVT